MLLLSLIYTRFNFLRSVRDYSYQVIQFLLINICGSPLQFNWNFQA
jgi:hypothetical protein